MRRRDIPLLAARLLSLASARHRKGVREFDPIVLGLFERYEWPGNIRELQNEIDRAVVLTPSSEPIRPEQLSADVRGTGSHAAPKPAAAAEKLASERPTSREARSGFEARFIADVLTRNGGNVSHSAEMLACGGFSCSAK